MSEHIEKHLAALLDNEVSEQHRVLFENHLGSCEACAQKMAELVKLSQLLNVHENPKPERSRQQIVESIIQQLPDRPVEVSWPRRLQNAFMWVPVVLFVVMVALQSNAWIGNIASAVVFFNLGGEATVQAFTRNLIPEAMVSMPAAPFGILENLSNGWQQFTSFSFPAAGVINLFGLPLLLTLASFAWVFAWGFSTYPKRQFKN